MIIINAKASIFQGPSYEDVVGLLESAGRICYRSEGSGFSEDFLARNIIKPGHLSVIEHASVSAFFVVDRGVSHELVRHRLASFSQESTRYCNYAGERLGEGVTFILPIWYTEVHQMFLNGDQSYINHPFYRRYTLWRSACGASEAAYLEMTKGEFGAPPQEARNVLASSVATRLVVTANMREWRHIFELRCAPAAHPQMREVMIPLFKEFRQKYPILFDDLEIKGA